MSDCLLCLGPCLKGDYCVVCCQRHEGYDTYSINDGRGVRSCTREEFAAFMGATFDAHGHCGNEAQGRFGSPLNRPMYESPLEMARWERAKAAYAELQRRGAIGVERVWVEE